MGSRQLVTTDFQGAAKARDPMLVGLKNQPVSILGRFENHLQ